MNYTTSDDSVVSVLACIKDYTYGLVLINNLDKEVNVSINVTAPPIEAFRDYESENVYTTDGIVLTPQQVLFLYNDATAPSLTLSSPSDGQEKGLLYLNSSNYNLDNCRIRFTCTNTTDDQCCGDTVNATVTYDHQVASTGIHSSDGSRQTSVAFISGFTEMAALAVLIVAGLIIYVVLRLYGRRR